jgi:uncharacterized protein
LDAFLAPCICAATLNESGFMAPKNSTACRSEAYRPQDSQRIHERLRALASLALSSGQSTILDAVHLRPEERYAAKMVAAQNNAHFTGLWLEAPLGMVKERIAKRAIDASDATVEVVTAQAEDEPGAMDWQPLDASASLETTVAGALAAIFR